MAEPEVQTRMMTEEQRREGVPLLGMWLKSTGDFITKIDPRKLNPEERHFFERMTRTFNSYNQWLRKYR